MTIPELLAHMLRSRPRMYESIWSMDPSEGPGTLGWVPGPLSLVGEVSIFIQLLMIDNTDTHGYLTCQTKSQWILKTANGS